MKILVAALLALLLLGGCGSKEGGAEMPVPASEKTPGAALYESLRAGSFNLGAAQESLRESFVQAEALRDAQVEGSDLREALAVMADLLDSAGAMLVDHSVAPTSLSEVEAAFGQFDEYRLKSIEAANDALHDLREARGIAEGLYESVPGLRAPLDQMASLHTVAEEDLRSALKSLGGKDESGEES